MTREKAKELLPIMQAFVDGKTIQFLSDKGKWIDIDGFDIIFTSATSRYRIKPEPTYRPFKDAEECWQEMMKHQPFGWIMGSSKHHLVSSVNDVYIWLSDKVYYTFEEALNYYTFADGIPFGIKEE